MKPPAVAIEVAEMFLKRYLSGFRGYPSTQAGERRFAEAVQLNAVSVEHVEAIVKSFDEGFPTVRQIHDVALNLRPQFEHIEDPKAEWERKYGKPVAFEKYPSDAMSMHWQAIRDALYYTEGPGKGSSFWAGALEYDRHNHPESLAAVRAQVAKFGWPALMDSASPPTPIPYSSPLRRGSPGRLALPTVTDRVTEADVHAAERLYRLYRNQKAIEESESTSTEGWEDPDR